MASRSMTSFTIACRTGFVSAESDALIRKGYSDADIEKILGGNTLRVMEQVEATAARLNAR